MDTCCSEFDCIGHFRVGRTPREKRVIDKARHMYKETYNEIRNRHIVPAKASEF